MTKGEWILTGIICLVALIALIQSRIRQRNENRLWKELRDLKEEEREAEYTIKYVTSDFVPDYNPAEDISMNHIHGRKNIEEHDLDN